MHKSKEQMQIQVGAFVGVGLILLMMVLFMLGSENKLFSHQYSLICRFENISGLRVGAPVQLAGIHVGSVSQIFFEDKIEQKKVKLILKVGANHRDRIRKDSEATIVTQGLLGDKMIFISVGSPEFDVIKDGEEIKTRSLAGFVQVMEKGDVLIDNVNAVAKNINSILEEIRGGNGFLNEVIYGEDGADMLEELNGFATHLNQASVHIENITAKIDRGQGTIGAFVNDATLYNDMKTLLGKANRNKLIRAVVRHTLKTKDEKLLKNP